MYQKYKDEFMKKNTKTAFNEHYKDKWFQEKYNPFQRQKRFKRQQTKKLKSQETFNKEFENF